MLRATHMGDDPQPPEWLAIKVYAQMIDLKKEKTRARARVFSFFFKRTNQTREILYIRASCRRQSLRNKMK